MAELELRDDLSLRDVLELAKEFRVRRLRVGEIEVEMSPEPEPIPYEVPRLPTEAEVRAESLIPRAIPPEYRRLFKSDPPSFADIQGKGK